MLETNYRTLEQFESEEQITYQNLPVRIKNEIDEYFHLCDQYSRKVFTQDEARRFIDLTLLAHKYDLSPLCSQKKVYKSENVGLE